MRLRPAWAAGLLLAGGALLAGWAWQGDRPGSPPAAAAAPRAVQALALPPPPPPAALRPAEAPAGRTRAAPSPAAAGAVVDLCGLGRMPTAAAVEDLAEAADLPSLPDPVGREPLAAARTALLAQLRQGDARGRTIALLLERPAPDDDAAHQAWAGELLQQAQASARPEALLWAEQACGAQPDPAGCRLGLIRARLRLEPDNAAHWAALADEDPRAADEAWRGLLQSRRWQERPQALLLATQAALPATLPGYLRLALGAEMQLRAQQLPSAGEGFVLERCQQAVPGRTEECGALARLMAERSDALRTLAEAASVAQAAGWPAERLRALRQEFQDLGHAEPPWQGGPSRQPLSCDSVQAWQRHLADVARVGELGALRAHRAGLPARP